MNNPTAPSKRVSVVEVKKLAHALENLKSEPEIDLFGANADFQPPLPQMLALTPEVEIIPPPVKDKRLRTGLKTDLNVLKDDHAEVLKIANALKEERLFAPTLRNGLRLMADLRAGRIDVLLELFPFVRDAIMQEVMR